MTIEREHRALTKRGYEIEDARVWREEIPPENTAPPERLGAIPAEWGLTTEEARAKLEERICPACGEGPFPMPLMHAAKKHGIDRFTMRDICGLTTTEKVIDPNLSAHFSEQCKDKDMTTVHEAAKRRRKPRRTRTGLQRNIQTIQAVNAQTRGGRATGSSTARQDSDTPQCD